MQQYCIIAKNITSAYSVSQNLDKFDSTLVLNFSLSSHLKLKWKEFRWWWWKREPVQERCSEIEGLGFKVDDHGEFTLETFRQVCVRSGFSFFFSCGKIYLVSTDRKQYPQLDRLFEYCINNGPILREYCKTIILQYYMIQKISYCIILKMFKRYGYNITLQHNFRAPFLDRFPFQSRHQIHFLG